MSSATGGSIVRTVAAHSRLRIAPGGRAQLLIEDDVYGELYFGSGRPTPAKAFDRNGLVMHCSSFSKNLAPGYRIGWVAPGRYLREAVRQKLSTTITTSAPAQAALATYLEHGGYDRHLRQLRQTLKGQQDAMAEAVARYFPLGTRATRPAQPR